MNETVTCDGKATHKTFLYNTHLHMESDRVAALGSGSHPVLHVSSPPAFKGAPELWTPEEFFVGAVEACLMLTFLATASALGLKVLSYSSEAEGTLERMEGKYRFTHMTVLPRILVSSKPDVEVATRALERACPNCIISNSIRPVLRVVPTIEHERLREWPEGL